MIEAIRKPRMAALRHDLPETSCPSAPLTSWSAMTWFIASLMSSFSPATSPVVLERESQVSRLVRMADGA